MDVGEVVPTTTGIGQGTTASARSSLTVMTPGMDVGTVADRAVKGSAIDIVEFKLANISAPTGANSGSRDAIASTKPKST